MKRIFKYPIQVDDYQVIEMNKGAVILTVQTQREKPCIWAIVDPDAPLEPRRLRLAGTGHPIDEPLEEMKYIGTFQLGGGAFIGHLFEQVNELGV